MEMLKTNLFKPTVLALIFSSLVTPFAAFAGTRDGGGGGTFVQSRASSHLVLWDYYANDPSFNDASAGDQIQSVNKWTDYAPLKSYDYLKQRLKIWQVRAPKLVNLVTDNGIMLRNDFRSRYSADFMILATPLYIQQISELAVPEGFPTAGVRAMPGAYFYDNSEVIVLSTQISNQAGLISQAGMLLHEKLRSVQLDFNISNEQLQSIVYFVMTKNPGEVSAEQYDDEIFSQLNFNPSPDLKNDNALSNMMGGQRATIVARKMFQMPSISAGMDLMSYFNSGYKEVPGEDAVQIAAKEGILGQKYYSDMKLVTVGNKNTPALSHHALTPPTGVILDGKNCLAVTKSQYDPTFVFDATRIMDMCSGQGLRAQEAFTGKKEDLSQAVGSRDLYLDESGALLFESPATSDFAVQVKAHLYSHQDAGSHIQVEANGVHVKLDRKSSDLAYAWGPAVVQPDSHWRPNINLDEVHAFVFRFRFKERKVSIYLNDDGNYLSSGPFVSWDLTEDVSLNRARVAWEFKLVSNSRVYEIKLMPTNSRSPIEPQIKPFDKYLWDNSDGVGYIIEPGQTCRAAFKEVYTDRVTGKSECSFDSSRYELKGRYTADPEGDCAKAKIRWMTPYGGKLCAVPLKSGG